MRKQLLKLFPFLGPCHQQFHAARKLILSAAGYIIKGSRREFFNLFWEARVRRAARASPKHRLTKTVVHLYAVCCNEERILPYFMAHYKPFVDHFTIYDNGSTDSTLELLKGDARVTVIQQRKDGVFDEGSNLRIKNSAWKASSGKADFVIVCDMDEFLYHPEICALLGMMKKNGFTVLKPCGYQMFAKRLPSYDGNSLLTDIVPFGVKDNHNYSKTVLFNPISVKEMHFQPGCHRSRPEGLVKVFASNHAKLLHYKYIDKEEIVRKMRVYSETLSVDSRSRGWGGHYQIPENQILAYYDEMLLKKRRVV